MSDQTSPKEQALKIGNHCDMYSGQLLSFMASAGNMAVKSVVGGVGITSGAGGCFILIAIREARRGVRLSPQSGEDGAVGEIGEGKNSSGRRGAILSNSSWYSAGLRC